MNMIPAELHIEPVGHVLCHRAPLPLQPIFVVHKQGLRKPIPCLGASSPHAGKVRAGMSSVHADGLMKMQQVQKRRVPAGGEVRFERWAITVNDVLSARGRPRMGERSR